MFFRFFCFFDFFYLILGVYFTILKLKVIRHILTAVLLLASAALAYPQTGDGKPLDDRVKQQTDSILALITDDTSDSLKAVYYNEIANISNNIEVRRDYAMLSLECCNHKYPQLILDNYVLISNCYFLSHKNYAFLQYNYTGILIAKLLGNNKYLMRFYKMMSVYHDQTNNSDSMFYYANKYLEISIKSQDTANMAMSYLELGLKYTNRFFFREGEECYRQALALDSARGAMADYAVDCYRLGELFVERRKTMDDIFTALPYLNRAIQVFDSLNIDNFSFQVNRHLTYDTYARAYIYLATRLNNDKYADTSFVYNRKARDYFFGAGYADSYGCYVSFTYLDYLLYYKRYDDALKILRPLKKNIGKTNVELLSKYYQYLRRVYCALGDYKNAYSAFEQYFEFSRSLSSDSTMAVISDSKTEQAVMLERIKSEKDLEIYRLEQRRMHTFNVALVSGLCLVSVFVFFILRALKFRKKANTELSEKNQMLAQQKNEITAQRDEISLQRDEIETVNTELLRSISYAERIQRAVVPTSQDVAAFFSDFFVFFHPRDIVSGDFYSAVKCGKYSVMITADCTGHGIPGAFLSMLGISAVKEFMVTEQDAENPGTVLDRMRVFVKSTLVKSYDGFGINDGMDMTISCFDFDAMEMRYAIANQKMYVVRNREAIKLTGDKMPVGRSYGEREHFQTFTQQLQHGDMIYMFSDGIQDQFGGELQKKFNIRNLVNTLVTAAEMQSADEQCLYVEQTVAAWRGDTPQVDDMTLVGIRV